jgi:GDSL-like Lipase/Acylhydrolase family
VLRIPAWLCALCLACSTRAATDPSTSTSAALPPVDYPPLAADPPPPAPPPPEPVVTPASTAAHAHVQARVLGTPLPASELVHFVAIEHADTALAHFHDALRKLAAGSDPDGKLRVAIYGSSSVAIDRYTAYLRGYLQHRFGDGGIGFVAAAPLWRWHRHNEVTLASTKGWTIDHAQKKAVREGGHLGLMGASANATRKRVGTTVRAGGRESFSPFEQQSLIDIHYLQQPKGGRFSVEIGDRKLATVSTRASAITPAVYRAKPPGTALEPLHLLLAGDGEVRLLGVSLEREDPGIVVDALGIGGTRAANQLVWNEPEWAQAVTARAPDLWVLAYGANECVDEDEPIETYRGNLDEVIDRFARAAPQSSCLLIGPVDFPVELEPDVWVPRARLEQIIVVQRELADARGCGFFDTRAMMGGGGTMDAWVLAELAKGDHLHFTKLGYTHLGRVLADALMRDYDAQ